MNIEKFFLLLSFVVVVAVALGYGADPAWFARSFLGVDDLPRNLAHILRAVMGLYIAFGLYWGAAAFSPQQQGTAIFTVLIFNAGLFLGRVLSFVADGVPATLLVGYTIFELCVLPMALLVLRHHRQKHR